MTRTAEPWKASNQAPARLWAEQHDIQALTATACLADGKLVIAFDYLQRDADAHGSTSCALAQFEQACIADPAGGI